jgi:uncharacterized protein YqeY
MSLIEKISGDFMMAYKAKDMKRKNFLGVIKSEVSKENKTPEDTYIIGKLKSMIKNAEATNSLTEYELNIINEYLPTQLNEEKLSTIIKGIIENNNISSPKEMGKAMSFLKSEFDGQYDGKLAAKITKELLG